MKKVGSKTLPTALAEIISSPVKLSVVLNNTGARARIRCAAAELAGFWLVMIRHATVYLSVLCQNASGVMGSQLYRRLRLSVTHWQTRLPVGRGSDEARPRSHVAVADAPRQTWLTAQGSHECA